MAADGKGLSVEVRPPGGAELDWVKLLGLALSVAVGLTFWDSPALLPLKLIAVMMHESGHAIATWVVGGRVDQIVLRADESGQCLSLLPPTAFGQILVYSSGYLGSTLAGAALLLATLRLRMRRAVLVASALWLVAMGALYGGDLFTVLFCLGTAAMLGLAARVLPASWVDGVNLFLAAFSSLYALVDLRDDLWNSQARALSDAALLAERTFVPAIVWAALWTLVSVSVLGLLGWYALTATRRSQPIPVIPKPMPRSRP